MAKQLQGDKPEPSTPHTLPGDSLPQDCLIWRCPNCGQLAFGDDAPFTCDFCGDAVTWAEWRDPQHQ